MIKRYRRTGPVRAPLEHHDHPKIRAQREPRRCREHARVIIGAPL